MYAWHPLALLGFAHAAHLESFVVLAVLAAALAWTTGRLEQVRCWDWRRR